MTSPWPVASEAWKNDLRTSPFPTPGHTESDGMSAGLSVCETRCVGFDLDMLAIHNYKKNRTIKCIREDWLCIKIPNTVFPKLGF